MMPTDPNAPTTQEQLRRARDRADVVLPSFPEVGEDDLLADDDVHADDDAFDECDMQDTLNLPEQEDAGIQDQMKETFPASSEIRRVTLNRRQTRSIRQGLRKAMNLHRRVYEASRMKPNKWKILEVFAGRATFSDIAAKPGKWDVLPPQDILYGLDLRVPEHQQWLKDMIILQEPDVVTLAPPCGPWSSWQRMRKRKDLLNALRQERKPFWEFVCWVWAYQTLHGRLVLLEQPKQSDALKQPMMTKREEVYQKEVHMCQLGLRDYMYLGILTRSPRPWR